MSVKKNFMYNIMYQILTMILPIITTPYISRVIGPKGIGIQSYTYSIVNYFMIFAMLGINNHGNRSIAMNRDDKDRLNRTFWGIYSVQLIMSLIMIVLYSGYILFIAKEYKLMLSIQLIYLIGVLLDINWFFFGIEEFKLTVTRNTIIKLVSVLSIFIFVKSASDLYVYALILALSNLISQIILWLYLKKHISLNRIKICDIRSNIKPILVLFIPVIAVSIYKIMDKIMLGSMSNVTQVGFYENSEKIINIPIGIVMALGTVMLPKMSNLLSKSKEKESERYISISIGFIMFVSIGAIFGIVGISNVIIPIFLGESFNACIDVVSLLSITIVFIAWANVIRTQILIPRGQDKVYLKSTFLGAIVNVVINMLMISRYGAIGAAIGTICAEIVVSVYQTIIITNEMNIIEYLKRYILFIVPGIIMFLIIKYIEIVLPHTLLTGIIQVIVGGGIYCIISTVYLLIIKDELLMSLIGKYKKVMSKNNI